MDAQYCEEFQKAGLPAETTESVLEALGARYFASKPFVRDGNLTRLEYMFLETDRKFLAWKRFEGEEIFKIHAEYSLNCKFEPITYVSKDIKERVTSLQHQPYI